MPQLSVFTRVRHAPATEHHPAANARSRMKRLPRRLSVLAVGLAVVAIVPAGTAMARDARPSAQGSGPNQGTYLVTFKSHVAPAEADRVVAASGATPVGRLDGIGTRVVKLPPAGMAAAFRRLANDPRVLTVEQDAVASATVLPSDPRWAKQWGPRKIRAPEAWNLSTGRGKTVIAIIDTGVDPRHPELRGRLLPGWDFHNNDSNARDDQGHGTAVANVAAAGGNDGVGIAGMCWNCKVLPVKVLNSNGSGSHSNIAAGIIWAADNGADVINLSIAGPRATTVMSNAVAYARRKGVIVIAAAGNEGSKKLYYPAAYPGVISVAATNGSDRLYSWSNRGRWVKLAAPGCAYTGKPGPAWSWWCGTSFATPAVAGVAALVKSLRPGISRYRLEKILLSSTYDVRGVSHGRIDALRAVRKAASLGSGTQTEPSPTPTPTPTPSEQPSYDWSGALSSSDRVNRRNVFLSGQTYVSLEWSSDVELTLRVKDSSGDIVLWMRDDDRFRDETFSPEPGWYEVAVMQWSDQSTEYRVRVN